jgi:hypothetical protein
MATFTLQLVASAPIMTAFTLQHVASASIMATFTLQLVASAPIMAAFTVQLVASAPIMAASTTYRTCPNHNISWLGWLIGGNESCPTYVFVNISCHNDRRNVKLEE